MLRCVNPATGQVIERIRCDDRRTVHNTFQKLQKGQRAWGRRDWAERVRLIEAFGNRLKTRREEQAKQLTRELGKPIRQARTEIDLAGQQIRALVDFQRQPDEASTKWQPTSGGGPDEQMPVGVVAHLSTWDFPVLAAIQMVIPALLAGNSVMYKPSTRATLVGKSLVELMWAAGIPEESISLVIGGGAVGDYMLDEAVAGVAFAGSYATGKNVCEKVAARMIPRHLDLMSKDGIYVCDDVEVQWVANKVVEQALYNAGQSRASVERVYVHDAVSRRFTEALCRCVEEYKIGNPSRENTLVGPLACHTQLDALEYQIGDAVQKGARLLVGGRADGGKGNFFRPTVLVDVDHRMLVMREDILGPIICIQPVADDDEAVDRLRDTDYGVTAAVFSESRQRACKLLGRLDVEEVYWNGYHGVCPPIASTMQCRFSNAAANSRPVMPWFTQRKSWRLPASTR